MASPDAVLLDIDGVLVVSWEALPGAVEALDRVRASGAPVRFLTNTTSSTRADIAARLRSAGFGLDDDEVLTATAAAAAHLRAHHPGARCWLLNHGDITADLPDVDLVDDAVAPEEVGVVLVGGAGPEFTWDAVNHALACVRAGAALVAAHHNDVWRTSDGLLLDAGPYLSAIERAAGVEAVVVGKPAPAMFEAGLTAAGASAAGSVMVGDHLDSDVRGAQHAGLVGVQVRTGKFRQEQLDSGEPPDVVLASIADLPDWLDGWDGRSRSPRH